MRLMEDWKEGRRKRGRWERRGRVLEEGRKKNRGKDWEEEWKIEQKGRGEKNRSEGRKGMEEENGRWVLGRKRRRV